MHTPERNTGCNQESTGANLPILEENLRGTSNLMNRRVLETPDGCFIEKRPMYDFMQLEGLEYFLDRLDKYPFLQKHTPSTVLVEEEGRQAILQRFVHAVDGKSNMAAINNDTKFDPTQIKDEATIEDIFRISQDCLRFWRESQLDPENNEDVGIGLMPEAFRPDSFILGTTDDSAEPMVYLTDNTQLMPYTSEQIKIIYGHMLDDLNEVCETNFNKQLKDVLAARNIILFDDRKSQPHSEPPQHNVAAAKVIEITSKLPISA